MGDFLDSVFWGMMIFIIGFTIFGVTYLVRLG